MTLGKLSTSVGKITTKTCFSLMSRVYGLKIEGMTMTDVQSIDLPPCNFTLPDNLYGGALGRVTWGYLCQLAMTPRDNDIDAETTTMGNKV